MTKIVDPVSESVVVATLDTFFNDCAMLDPKTVARNMECLCEGKWSKSDRAIAVSLCDKLLKDVSVFFLGLVVNNDFRQEVKTAVTVELGMDSLSPEEISAARKEMSQPKESGFKDKYYVINLKSYNQKIVDRLVESLAISFDRLTAFEDVVGEFVDELTYEERCDIGFCISNFAYLIRAFSKNDTFAAYTMGVLKDVAEHIGC